METSKIPTAEQFLKDEIDITGLYFNNTEMNFLIHKLNLFARLHVQKALEAAAENVETIDMGETNENGRHIPNILIDSSSILNAYPLDNIK